MIIRKITIMMIALNAAALFLAAAGSDAVWGIEFSLGYSETIAAQEDRLSNVESGVSGIEAVAGIAALAIQSLNLLYGVLTLPLEVPQMFSALGIPNYIVSFVFAPLYTVVLIDVVAILRGESNI